MAELIIKDVGPDDLDGLLQLYLHLNSDEEPCSPDTASVILDQVGRYNGSAILAGKVDEVIVASCTLIVIPNLTRKGSRLD